MHATKPQTATWDKDEISRAIGQLKEHGPRIIRRFRDHGAIASVGKLSVVGCPKPTRERIADYFDSSGKEPKTISETVHGMIEFAHAIGPEKAKDYFDVLGGHYPAEAGKVRGALGSFVKLFKGGAVVGRLTSPEFLAKVEEVQRMERGQAANFFANAGAKRGA